jgi:hypothetical protein
MVPGAGRSTVAVITKNPINLERNRAVGHPMYNECIDKHWMAYHDSSCSFDDLVRKNALPLSVTLVMCH